MSSPGFRRLTLLDKHRKVAEDQYRDYPVVAYGVVFTTLHETFIPSSFLMMITREFTHVIP